MVVGGSGAITFSASAAMTSGALGYRVVGQSGQSAYFTANLPASKTQVFRGTFRAVAIPGITREILSWRSGPATQNIAMGLNSGSAIFCRDAAGATFLNGPAISAGVDYDISCRFTSGASTNDGRAELKVFNKASGTQVGSTASASAANLGTLAASAVRIGIVDAAAAGAEFWLDTLRFENDRLTEFPPHTALAYFDAENGVDGAMVTASTLPGSAGQGAIGANSFFRFDAATPIWGRQGYHVAASTGENSWIGTLSPFGFTSRQLAARFGFRWLQAASASRPIVKYGSALSAAVVNTYLHQTGKIHLFGAGLASTSNFTLTASTDYEIAVNMTVGSSTNDGVVTGRIYDRGGTLLDTWGASTANLQGASAGFSRARLGADESTSTRVEYVFDSIRLADTADVLPSSIPASANVMITSDLVSSAVRVPKVTNGLLRLI